MEGSIQGTPDGEQSTDVEDSPPSARGGCHLPRLFAILAAMRRFDTVVLENREVAQAYRELRFAWNPDEPVSQADALPSPGRFLTVRPTEASDPLLRRPFAFSGYDPEAGQAAFVFQVRGTATRLLASLRPGAFLDVLGPLGKGFPPPPRGSRPVLVGGGIGLGPMVYAAREFRRRAAELGCEAPVLVLGFRTAAQVPAVDLPEGTAICTDDGSVGFRGTTADYVDRFDPGAPPAYYACGPAPMMAALDSLAATRRAPFWAAVEQWMACGVGACLGCAVKRKDGSFARACTDGPVFDGSTLDWGRTGR